MAFFSFPQLYNGIILKILTTINTVNRFYNNFFCQTDLQGPK